MSVGARLATESKSRLEQRLHQPVGSSFYTKFYRTNLVSETGLKNIAKKLLLAVWDDIRTFLN
jgi:hypothetical protein